MISDYDVGSSWIDSKLSRVIDLSCFDAYLGGQALLVYRVNELALEYTQLRIENTLIFYPNLAEKGLFPA